MADLDLGTERPALRCLAPILQRFSNELRSKQAHCEHFNSPPGPQREHFLAHVANSYPLAAYFAGRSK
jgi:hypothetical protein